MTDEVPGNDIRILRRKHGISQRELGILVGYPSCDSVGRHERSEVAPPLLIALAYEIVFGVPVGQIFLGFRAVVAQAVVRNAEELRMEMEKHGGEDSSNHEKSQWLAQLKRHIENSTGPRWQRDN